MGFEKHDESLLPPNRGESIRADFSGDDLRSQVASLLKFSSSQPDRER
jgi:hypothetical protein